MKNANNNLNAEQMITMLKNSKDFVDFAMKVEFKSPSFQLVLKGRLSPSELAERLPVKC